MGRWGDGEVGVGENSNSLVPSPQSTVNSQQSTFLIPILHNPSGLAPSVVGGEWGYPGDRKVAMLLGVLQKGK